MVILFKHRTDLLTYEQLWTLFLVQVNHRTDLQLELTEILTFQGLGQQVDCQAMEATASNLPATKHLFITFQNDLLDYKDSLLELEQETTKKQWNERT